MKLSLTITALILATFVGAGWWQHGAVSQLRTDQQRLVSQAAALGLATGEERSANPRQRSADRPRIDREAEAKSLAVDLISIAQDMGDHPGEPDAATQESIADIIERIYRLDPDQIRILLDELRHSPDLPDDTRQEIISFAIDRLAESHPEAAILLLPEVGDPVSRNGMIGKILGSWAAKDPLATLNWMRTDNAGTFGPSEAIKFAMITGCARNNPKLALQWVADLQITSTSSAIPKIVETAQTPEAQHAMFSAIRELYTIIPAPNIRQYFAMGTLAHNMAEQDYDATQAWLAIVKPTPQEAAILANGLRAEKTQAESGKWIEWMGEHLPPDQFNDRAERLMNDWTTLDYRAAGEWLATTADGTAKQAAVAGYAITMAPYKPAIAAQWAETLPADQPREDLLRQIHSAWHKLDAPAAANFAEKHGIKP